MASITSGSERYFSSDLVSSHCFHQFTSEFYPPVFAYPSEFMFGQKCSVYGTQSRY